MTTAAVSTEAEAAGGESCPQPAPRADGASHHKPRGAHRRANRAATLVAALAVAAGAWLFSTTNHAYVVTPSMYPTIAPGSMVFIRHQRTYHVGEVIEFRANGLLWVHRLIGIKPNGHLVTKGDNPHSVPDLFVPATTMKDVVGSVAVSVPYLGFPQLLAHQPTYALAWLRAELGLWGRLIMLALVALLAWTLFVGKKEKRQVHSKTVEGPGPTEVSTVV